VLDDDFDCWAPAGWTTAWVTSADSPAGSVITSQAVTDPDGNNPGYLTILKIPVRQGAPAQSLATIHKQPQGFSPAVAATSKLVTFTTALVNGQKHVYTVSATAASKPTQIGSDRNVRTPSFSPDGKHLIWTQGDTIREYTFATKKTITLINNGGPSPSWG
jgi:Tol biopolymer transport system component